MAITKLNNYTVGDIDLTAMVLTLDKSFKGNNLVTISAYDTTAAPDVKVGSLIENNGTFFIVDTSDITPTGYSGISVSTTFYLYYNVGTAAFIYSETAPTWSDSKQGWYNSNDRAFFSMFKDSGGTLYEDKAMLPNQSKGQLSGDLILVDGDLTVEDGINKGAGVLKQKLVSLVIASGAGPHNIAHGLTVGNIRGLQFAHDASTAYIDQFRLNGANIQVIFDASVATTLYCIISYV